MKIKTFIISAITLFISLYLIIGYHSLKHIDKNRIDVSKYITLVDEVSENKVQVNWKYVVSIIAVENKNKIKNISDDKIKNTANLFIEKSDNGYKLNSLDNVLNKLNFTDKEKERVNDYIDQLKYFGLTPYRLKEDSKYTKFIEEIKDATGKTIYELICPQFLKRNPHFTVGYIVRKNLQAEINTINDKNTLSNNRISKLKFTICDKEFSIINMHVNKYTIDIPVGNENTILLGDMNACTENQATDNKAINVKFLKRIKNKGWIEVESNEPIYTWKSNGIEKKLDHIYIYKDLDNQQSIVTSAEPAVNFYYNQSGFTDHTMLVIEFPVININSSLQR